MKILQVMAGGQHGGAETAFVDMCIAMHDAGLEVVAVIRPSQHREEKLRAAGVTVHTLPFGNVIDVYTRWALKRLIKQYKPDIVQGWMSRACNFIPRWSLSMGIKSYKTVARLGSPYKLKYFKSCEYFVALTPAIQKHIEAAGVNANRITQIPNFAEIEPAKTKVRRADFQTPEHAPLVLGLGRLHPDKAFDTLIKVAETLPDIHVWIAGEGPQRTFVESLIKELDLSDRVKLLGWCDDRAALFEAVDLCAFISRDEGFGTVFLQSWAQKTPLVVSEADGPKQFVVDEKEGLIVAIDDVDATSHAINRLLKEDGLASYLVENGYERYQNNFTKPVIVDAYSSFYKSIIEAE